MYWILLLLSVILFFGGVSMLIGAGWALALFELITHTTPSGSYADMQQSFKGAKKLRYRILGIFLMIAGFILFMYSAGRI